MSNIKLCKSCREKNNQDLFYSGYYNWLSDDCYECPMKNCGHKLVDINLSKEAFDIITSISKDIAFLDAMVKLHDEDIIEYNLKMSQFRMQVEQQKSSSVQDDNCPHCPICNSTNLKKISGLSKAGSVALWGIFAAGRTSKTWHCNSCGSEW